MRIIAIGNQKGGVSKTTTTHNLGDILAAEHGQRVLLVDCDAQRSLTDACGAAPKNGSLADVLDGVTTARGSILQLDDNLFLLPADRRLAEVQAMLFTSIGREAKLERALQPLGEEYDICLIDCPPSLNLMTVNALAAADEVLIPCLPQMADVRGLLLFMETVREVRDGINPRLRVLGILPTFHDSRLLHHQAVLEELERSPLPLLPVQIGRSIRITEAAAAGEGIRTYDPGNKQLPAYRALARRVLNG